MENENNTNPNDISEISEGPRPDLYCFPLQPRHNFENLPMTRCSLSKEARVRCVSKIDNYSHKNLNENYSDRIIGIDDMIKKSQKNRSKSRTKFEKMPLQQSTIKNEGKIQCPDSIKTRCKFPENSFSSLCGAESTNQTQKSLESKSSLLYKLACEIRIRKNSFTQSVNYFQQIKEQIENVF